MARVSQKIRKRIPFKAPLCYAVPVSVGMRKLSCENWVTLFSDYINPRKSRVSLKTRNQKVVSGEESSTGWKGRRGLRPQELPLPGGRDLEIPRSTEMEEAQAVQTPF